MTFLAALRSDRIDAPCVLDGPINGATFNLYVEEFLVPTLNHGDIVIMDNLGSHKTSYPKSYPTCWSKALLPATVQSRPQPY
ncbi:hypothetical protein MMA231_00415 [Asticcacaulis sp. MM231]